MSERISGYLVHQRLPTISFVHSKLKSDEIVKQVDGHRIKVRGFLCKKLIESLNLKEKNGVVRVSLAHYNTEEEEVRKLISVLKEIF